MFVDSHAHIDGPEFDVDRDEVVARARSAGVGAILNVGTGDPRSGALERAIETAELFENVYAAVGVHPHDARLFDEEAAARILKLVRESPRILAWGEIGLDYHYDNSPREVQREVFRIQLRLAREAQLPIIIHTREAEEDTVKILSEEWSIGARGGILHCFTGSQWLSDAALELGFLISFSGVVTFKKAGELREVARRVPLERLLVETDCPFLAPVPHRGKRNEPSFVVEVARTLAELRGMEIEEFGRRTTENFHRFFNLETPQTSVVIAPQAK